MATRTTILAAQELKEQFETWFPGHEFRILDNDLGFAVVEVHKCHCGVEVFTHAVGEEGKFECESCRKAGKAKATIESARLVADNAESVAHWNARDAWEEDL